MKKTHLLTLLVLLVVGCSSVEKKRINEEVKQETQVVDGQSLNQEIHQLIANSKTLTPEKKQLLVKIVDDIRLKNKALTEESYKYRAVLMKELLTGKSGRKAVVLVEKQMTKVEKQRIKNTIKGAEQISAVIDGQEQDQQIIHTFMLREFR